MKNTVLIVTLFCLILKAHAQSSINWQNKDLEKDGTFGISTEKAYKELLKGKKATPVIVAIIDSGIDTAQADLQSSLWINAEKGHGRNYLATEIGQEDVTRLASYKREFYDSISYTLIPEVYRADYQLYTKTTDALKGKQENMRRLISELQDAKIILERIEKGIGKSDPKPEDFAHYKTVDPRELLILNLLNDRINSYPNFQRFKFCELDNLITLAEFHLQHGLNDSDSDSFSINKTQQDFNFDISPDALGLILRPNYTSWHGTHVAGIIGAIRNNGIGLDGVADNVKIMMLKVVGNIREIRDQNLANAIRYAVDNGAKVVNMSFGKPYTWNKKAVDNAVKYAIQKDVLLILASGNEGINLDKEMLYPNRLYENGEEAKAWLEVGASDSKDDNTLAASFSNYGKTTVDVFAPGVQIYSTIPDSKYEYSSGTSMAAPMVTGLAALIREYYPKLNAMQVKEVIMHSVVKRDVLKDKCVSGGIVNAYEALKLAATYPNPKGSK